MLFLTADIAFVMIGNELSGSGVSASVSAELYGKDLIKLKDVVNNLYKNSDLKPSLVAPGGFFDKQWYAKLLQVTGSGIVNFVTHHIYNLGAGGLSWFNCTDICL
jgi:heparanase 1